MEDSLQYTPIYDMVLFTGADDVSENTMEMNKSKSGKGRKKLPVRILKGPKTDSKQVQCTCTLFYVSYLYAGTVARED